MVKHFYLVEIENQEPRKFSTLQEISTKMSDVFGKSTSTVWNIYHGVYPSKKQRFNNIKITKHHIEPVDEPKKKELPQFLLTIKEGDKPGVTTTEHKTLTEIVKAHPQVYKFFYNASYDVKNNRIRTVGGKDYYIFKLLRPEEMEPCKDGEDLMISFP